MKIIKSQKDNNGRKGFRLPKKLTARLIDIAAVIIIVIPILLYFGPTSPVITDTLLDLDSFDDRINTLSYRQKDNAVSIHIIDVGQAEAILIAADDGSAMTIDCGEYDTIDHYIDYLKLHKIKKLKYTLFTHPHSDHMGACAQLISSFPPDTILLAKGCEYDKAEIYSELMSIPTEYLSCGDSFSLGGVNITVLGPVRDDYSDENDRSLVLHFAYGDTSFILTGDASETSEADMLSLWGEDELRCDLLKLGHHGAASSSSEAFLDACKPALAVCSCGRANEYGHPQALLLERLAARNITLYRTDINGSVIFETDGKSLYAVK